LSRSGEHWGNPGGRPGTRTGLVRVDAIGSRCPVCGRGKFCSVSRDGGMVWCTREASRDERDYGYGVAWVHVLDAPVRLDPEALRRVALAREPGDIELRNRVYTALLRALPLDPRHRANLRGRGLDDEQIELGGYASMPQEGRGYIARELHERFDDDLARVPGFYQWEDGRWAIAGFAGLLVPVRDVAGAIEGLKVRLDNPPPDGGRYRYVSSSSKGGAKAVATLHVPLFGAVIGADEIRITEGELKADVATALSGIPTLSVPGVEAWRFGLQAAEVLRPQRVRVAFDMDRDTNPAVARAQRALVSALRGAGFRVGVESWDPAFKGVDDFYSAQRAQRAAQ
jgi:hypothetical protein